ncbi:hypothetical protein L6452_35245 [Arctium lappa]|uniref:Uncharacterized protein n=1 Tax=Arctium lappa TaxID=4217 RepID=A0ACB8Y6H6_ARCLA|nr:hypothetical protein L6452_35245 [Arctium lappa]
MYRKYPKKRRPSREIKTERTGKDSVDRKARKGHSRKEKVGKEKVGKEKVGRHIIRSYNDVVKGKEKENSPSEEVIEPWQAKEGLKNRKEGEDGKQGSQRIEEIEVVGESVQVNDADVAQKDEHPVGRSSENQSQNQRAEGGVQESRQRDFEKSPCSKVMSASNDEGGGDGVDVEKRECLDNFGGDFENGQNQGGFLEKGFGPGGHDLKSTFHSGVGQIGDSENGQGRTESHVEGGRNWQDGEREEENETGMFH